MKTKLLPILFLISITIQGQNYFPVNVGDMRFWDVLTTSDPPGGITYTSTSYQKFAFTDSLIFSGDTFCFWNRYNGYYRFDIEDQILYTYFPDSGKVETAVDFNLQPGEKGNWFFEGEEYEYTVENKDMIDVFGEQVISYRISRESFSSVYNYHAFIFADKFGYIWYLSGYTTGMDSWSYEGDVYGFIMGGNFVNVPLLQFAQVSPVGDRPEDQFPFTLTATVEGKAELVDSIYLKYILQKGDEYVLNTWKKMYKIGSNYYTCSVDLHPVYLEPGDKVLFRVTRYARHAYNGIEVYPDSGFAVMNVLPATSVVQESGNSPSEYSLFQNYPNPFNPITKIKFAIGQDFRSVYQGWPVRTTLRIYNTLGTEVTTLVDDNKEPGIYEVEWNAEGFASGVYFCEMKSGEYSETMKLILLK